MRAKNRRGSCEVSVVVPTYKRPELLRRCLRALMAQDYAPTNYEVIIVDDAACEETRRMVECYAQTVRECDNTLRYIPVNGRHGPAVARNIGWRAAHGEIIAFTDDDCIPTPDWLTEGMRAFENYKKEVVGVSGRIIVPLSGVPTDYERNAAHLETSEFVTANCFYRRSCLEAVGGFDERFTAAWREDSDLFFMLMQRNALLISEPEAIVVHPLRPAQWGVSLSQQRKSVFNALLYKKHPALYRQKVQAAPPWHYYVIVGALLAMLGGITGKFPRITFAAACLWLVLTGRFCLQRLHDTSTTRSHRAEMIYTSILIPPVAIFWRLRGAFKFRVFFL